MGYSMSTFFRLSVVAVAVVMASTMSAVAGNGFTTTGPSVSIQVSPIAKFGDTPKHNQKWFEEDYENPYKNPCRDTGSDCINTGDQYYIESVSASAQPVQGGYIITASMIPLNTELASGVKVGTFPPTAGTVLLRGQYEVRISSSPVSSLRNVVVDFGGCVVDQNLNVTKFIPIQ
ncbi:MAG: hypothetical protein FGM24_02840 [Candidatus Kapabacteria bacterium]|nr:hypothetical protein [Candidatus Kapabacteria bacterium]